MRCDGIIELLDAYRTNELESSKREAVEAHLAGCQTCSIQVMRLKRLAERLRALSDRTPVGIKATVMTELGDRLGRIATAIGPAWVGFNDRGITFVSLQDGDAASMQRMYRARLGRDAAIASVPSRFAEAVADVAEGNWTRDVPVDLVGLPEFERAVLEALRTIPRGELRPYAWLAAVAGSPRAVRAVGNIMNRNPIPLLLPCHRVIPSGGGVGNYAYGSDVKRTLLEREGVSTALIDQLARRRVRYIGSDTTRIYCYPTCRDARRIQPKHQVPFGTEREAGAAGYRPCQHCRPLAAAV